MSAGASVIEVGWVGEREEVSRDVWWVVVICTGGRGYLDARHKVAVQARRRDKGKTRNEY